MTSISGMSAMSMMTPGDRMKLQLQSAVSAGTVKSTDATALGTALDDIDTAMKSGGTAAGTSPGGIKSKVDSLIAQEVKDGKLTDDQATELKAVFADAAKSMGGPGGAGGPPPGPPPGGKPSDDDDSTTSTASSSTDTTKSAIEALIAFLKQLEQTTASSSTYGSSGTSSGGTTSASMLVDASA